MILYEFEGKELLKAAGIAVPNSEILTSSKQKITLKPPLVLKAQVLSGKRAEAGGIIKVNKLGDLESKLKELFGKTVNKEKVAKVSAEKLIDFDQEYYLSISYDTNIRGPVLTMSVQGGTGVEEKQVQTYPIDPISHSVILNVAPSKAGAAKDIIQQLINLFFSQDCLLLEINPLVKTKAGNWLALDAKIKLDDEAKFRHEDWTFPQRGVPGYTPTNNEIEAKKIDQSDYRGTAGSAYFDLPGDIAILSSGGGVSLTAMDALIAVGGKPANFTEYSGNPPKEKVAKLTKIVLDKPNIHGLWVIGTVAANFTDIFETLSGIIEGLREAEKQLKTKFKFPIVIRRGGPRIREAYEMLRRVKDFDLHLQGPETSIAQSAQIMADLAKEYATSS